MKVSRGDGEGEEEENNQNRTSLHQQKKRQAKEEIGYKVVLQVKRAKI